MQKSSLIDSKWRKLAEVKGNVKNLSSPHCYEIAEENGTTEIVKLRPCAANQNMEQFGHVVALFYLIDAAAVSELCPTSACPNL